MKQIHKITKKEALEIDKQRTQYEADTGSTYSAEAFYCPEIKSYFKVDNW